MAAAECELTELCGDDREVVPGVLLAVQLPQNVDRAVTGVHVKNSVHVGPSVNGVPAEGGSRGGVRRVCVCTPSIDLFSSLLSRLNDFATDLQMKITTLLLLNFLPVNNDPLTRKRPNELSSDRLK